MQRQSLSSPNSKLTTIHGGGSGSGGGLLISPVKQTPNNMITVERRDSLSSSSDDDKSLKPRRFSLSHSSAKPENLIHLIPILTFVCFLVLYLSSHSPSQSDLAQFHGFQRPSKHLDSIEISGGSDGGGDRGGGRFVELESSDMLSIQSLRNLQESKNISPKSRTHRKFADF